MSLEEISQMCQQENHASCDGQLPVKSGVTSCQCTCHGNTIPSTSYGAEGEDTKVDKGTT